VATKPETLITNACMRLLRGIPDSWWKKNHGSVYSGRGWPDIEGMVDGMFFGIEVKRPGRDATPIQAERLRQIREAGGIVAVVHSVHELRALMREHGVSI